MRTTLEYWTGFKECAGVITVIYGIAFVIQALRGAW